MQMSVVLPKQRLTYKEKSKDDFKWAKDCIQAVATRTYQYNSDFPHAHSDIQRKLVNYRLYNNQIDQSDFERECNPFNIQAEEFVDRIQPYNKLANKINVLLGEELKRPFNLRAYLVNSSAVNAQTRAKDQLQRDYINHSFSQEILKYKKQLMSQFGNIEDEQELQALEEELNAEVDKIVSPEMMDKYLSTSWRDAVEIMVDQLLQWYNRKLRIRHIKNDSFKHALISGEEFVWVGIRNNQPVIELLNPLKYFGHKSSETQFAQDGLFGAYRTRMTPGDVLDTFGDDMTEEQKEMIDKTQALSNLYGITDEVLNKEINLLDLNQSLEWRLVKGGSTMTNIGSYGPAAINDLDVIHVEWVSQREFGYLTYIDEHGEPQKDLVDESFVIPESATKVKYTDIYGKKRTKYVWVNMDITFELEWEWLPEVWEGTQIAYNIYVNIRPKPYQSRNLNDPYKVKLGYHGLTYNAMNAPNISLFDRGKPFQYLYFILLHKMKEVIAKDMPPLTMIDMSMIPKTLTNEQWLYYYKQGLGFYDPNQNNEGNPQNVSGQKGPAFEVPRSAMQHANNYVQLLAWVDNQINEVMGVSKQRELGSVSPYEPVASNQQAITQSSHITEMLFQMHNTLWEQVLTSFVETVQICFKDDPQKIPVILDDLSRAVIELKPEMLEDSEIGVFITDNPNDVQALEQFRQMALTFAQNGSTVAEIAKIFKATSMQELEREAQAIDKAKQILLQQQEEAQREHERIMQERELENREDQQLHEIELAVMNNDAKKEIAAMQVFSRQETMDADGDGQIDPIEAAEVQHKINIENRKVSNEERSQQFEEIKQSQELAERNKDRQLEKEKMEKDLQKERIKAKAKPKTTTKKK